MITLETLTDTSEFLVSLRADENVNRTVSQPTHRKGIAMNIRSILGFIVLFAIASVSHAA